MRLLIEIVLVLLGAWLGGRAAKWCRQPAVLGELLAGVALGGSLLGLVEKHAALDLFAQLGVIVLLFEAGLATDYDSFMKVKFQALAVAVVGVICPFVFGYLISLAAGLGTLTALFVGATLTATSIGITLRVFRDLDRLASREAQVVIGAAVVDDVIGLVLLALLVGAVQLAGSAVIVLAFAAGLFFSRTVYRSVFLWLIKPFAFVLVPVFFVMSGVMANLRVFHLSDPRLWLLTLFLLLAAVAGKLLSGWVAGARADGWLVGVGMVPRGEVGLIFVAFGLSRGILTAPLYASLLAVIFLTTLVTPPLLGRLLAQRP